MAVVLYKITAPVLMQTRNSPARRIAFTNKATAQEGATSYTEVDSAREVNCGLSKSIWRLAIYYSAEKGEHASQLLRTGKVVYVHDPESKLTLDLHNGHDEDSAPMHRPFGAFFDKYGGEKGQSSPASTKALWVVERNDETFRGGHLLVGGEGPLVK